jgi:DNA-binding transcriptional MerR regulator
MPELLISELAARSGFSAPTLRYYERIGLLPAPRRTGSGYRVYDEDALDRLRFVARAKSLGLTLDETRELAGLWSSDECQPVQTRLAELLRDKRGAARHQMHELDAFVAQLDRVAGNLGRHVPDGPCDDTCGCATDVAEPIVCTLAATDVDDRLRAWRAVLDHAREVVPMATGVRVVFDDAVSAAEVAALAQAEHACCAFMSFTVEIDGHGVALTIEAAADARSFIDALVGLAPLRFDAAR